MLRPTLLALLFAAICVFVNATRHEVRIVYTGYVHGGITVASQNGTFCVTNGRGELNDADPDCMGGCARRQAVIEAVRQEYPDTVTVDIGGYLWGSIYYTTYGGAPGIDCFNRAKYDVSGLAGSDLYASASDIKQFLTSASAQGTTFVMTNGRLGADSSSPFHGLSHRSAVHTLPNGVRLGFVSILNPKFSHTTTLPPGEVTVNPSGGTMERDLRLEIAHLRRAENVDYVVLLATYEETRPVDYLLQFEGVQVVLLARSYGRVITQPTVFQNLYGEPVIIGLMGSDFGIDVGFLDLVFVDGKLQTASDPPTGPAPAYPEPFPFPSGMSVVRLTPQIPGYPNGSLYDAPVNEDTLDDFNTNYNLIANESFTRTVSMSLRPVSGDSGSGIDGMVAYGCRSGPCPMGRAIVDAFAAACPDLPARGCISMMNAGGIRASFFPRSDTDGNEVSAEELVLNQWATAARAAAASAAAGDGVNAADQYEALSPYGHSRHADLRASRTRSHPFTPIDETVFAPPARLSSRPSTTSTSASTSTSSSSGSNGYSPAEYGMYGDTDAFPLPRRYDSDDNGSSARLRAPNNAAAAAATEDGDTPFPVRAVDAFQVLPFLNTFGHVRVRGSSVRKIIGRSLAQGHNGRVLQHNLNVVINPHARSDLNDEGRVLDVRVPVGVGSVPIGTVNVDGWVPLVDDAEYTIVTSAYLIEGNDGFGDLFLKDFPETYVDTAHVLSDVFTQHLAAQHAAGVPLDYPTMDDDFACSQRDPLSPSSSASISPTADCRAIVTNMTTAEYNRCPTSLSFCANRNGESLFGALYVDANKCDQCSSLGVCIERRCVCSGIYSLPSTVPNGDPTVVSVVAGAPESGPWKGVVLVEGPACSKVRSVWSLSAGHRAAIATPGALTALVSLLAIIAVAVWRKHPVIKALTPFLCGMQCVGGLIGSVSILADAAYANDVTCTLAVWALCIGFTLLIGTMVVKLHRIKQIITAAQLQAKVAYTELQALGGVMILFAVNLVVLIVYTAHEPARMVPKALSTEFAVGDFCKSDERVYTTTFLTFNAVILVAGLYLALRTRNESANFSECKFMGFSLFNTAFMALVTFVVTFVVSKYDPTVSIIARAWLVFYIVTTTLGLILVPRLVLIYRNVTEVESYQAKASALASGIEAQKQSARDKRIIQTLSHRLRGRRVQVRERDSAIAASTALLQSNGLDIPRYDPLVEIPTEDWDPDDPAAAAAALGSNVQAGGAGGVLSGGETEMQPLTVGIPPTSSNGSGGSGGRVIGTPVAGAHGHNNHGHGHGHGHAGAGGAAGAAGNATRRPMFGNNNRGASRFAGPPHSSSTAAAGAGVSTGAAAGSGSAGSANGSRATSPQPAGRHLDYSRRSPSPAFGAGAGAGGSSSSGTGGTIVIPRTSSPALRTGSPALRNAAAAAAAAAAAGGGVGPRSSLGGAPPHRASLGGASGTTLYPSRSQSSVRRSHRGSGVLLAPQSFQAPIAAAPAVSAAPSASPSPSPVPRGGGGLTPAPLMGPARSASPASAVSPVAAAAGAGSAGTADDNEVPPPPPVEDASHADAL